MSRALWDRGRAQHGFTLIEVLVSALLVLIISAGVATALVSATDYTGHERNQSQADSVAQQDQERLKSMTDAQLTSLHQTRTVTLAATNFTVASTASFLSATGTSSCTSKAVAYFKLTSTVTSAGTAGSAPQTVTAETIITRPLSGSLVVPVQDQTGAPLSGVGINIVGQSSNYTQSAMTDQNGCVAFSGLPTDSYTVTATDAGYVDANGNASPSESASVNQTSVTSATTIIMGLAGQVKVGFVTQGTSVAYDQYVLAPYASGHGKAPTGAELSYYGTGNGIHMTTAACLTAQGAACSGSGTFSATAIPAPVAPGNLFPFYLGSSAQYTNNYQVWAGACEQEQPLQPPGGTDFASVTPGMAATPMSATSVDATVVEPAIDVAVKYNGTAYLPSHLDIQFNGTGTASCQDTWKQVPMVGTETVNGTVYGIYPAPFASQSPAGSATASATGDQGTISVCADYNNRYEWSPAMANTNFTAPTPVLLAGNKLMDVATDTASKSGPCP